MPADLAARPGWLGAALALEPGAVVPMVVGRRTVARADRRHLPLLVAEPGLFQLQDGTLQFQPALDTPQRRSDALAAALARLRGLGHVPGWRDERILVPPAPLGAEAFRVERAARMLLGITGYATHLNGWSRAADCAERVWVARRSESKAVDPGRLDNLVAGGVAAGMDELETLVKECWEEAGIPAELARRARPAGTIAFDRLVDEGVDSQLIAVFDLELPGGFVPDNQDGEVQSFEAVDAARLREMLEQPDLFTVDAALVALDFLARRAPRA